MKYFLIGLAIWLVGTWLPWFVKSWVTEWKIKRAKKRASREDKWMYDI